jgi:hypothetical protein
MKFLQVLANFQAIQLQQLLQLKESFKILPAPRSMLNKKVVKSRRLHSSYVIIDLNELISSQLMRFSAVSILFNALCVIIVT